MNTPSLFDFRGHNVRVTMSSGTPWFVAVDVCRILGLTNTAMALKPLGADEKHQSDLGLPGRKPFVISESGLYKLVMRSDKPEAREFQDWVTRVVLPSELAQVC